jgi:ubiquinol-cytochrome c reductase cytochrome b subunit
VRVRDWFDRRTGYRAVAQVALEEPVRGGASWAYVFGSALALTFAMQVVTGVLLALFYSPSTTSAWGSIHYIQHDVPFAWFVRGMHHYGSSAMVVLVVLHLFQTCIYRAYAPPREVNWWSGLLLLAVVLGFSVTGYLLPWDQKGFWATRVVTSIAGALPLIGHWLKTTIQGGNDMGNLTLTRFFGFHVFLLPGLLGVFLVIHVAVFRRHGVTVRASRKPDEVERATEPFWPRQVTYDVVFFSLIVAILAVITIVRGGASLEAPADPASGYPGRPEWYFLWLFELLKLVPGSLEGVAITSLVAVIAVFLALLPLVDRRPDATSRSRRPHFVTAAAIAAVVLTLTIVPIFEDATDPGLAKQMTGFEEDARRAFRLAEKGIPPGGPGDLYLNDPTERGRKLFAENCEQCHKAGAKGGDSAPDLTGIMTPAWVRGVTADPTQPQYFGHTPVTGMQPTDATPEELDKLVAYVLSLGSATKPPPDGAQLFEDQGCHNCHALAGEPPRMGPSLAGYGSREWLAGAIKTPGAPAYYGDQNKMPAFAGKLTDAQVDDLVNFLLATAGQERK